MSVTSCRPERRYAGAACAPSAASMAESDDASWVDPQPRFADGRVYGLGATPGYSAARAGRSALAPGGVRVSAAAATRPARSTCRMVNPSGAPRSGVRRQESPLPAEICVDSKRRLYDGRSSHVVRIADPRSSSIQPLFDHELPSAAIAVSTGGPKGREPAAARIPTQRSATGGSGRRRCAEAHQNQSPITRKSRV